MEIEIDLPGTNYRFSRFDWSGNIVNAWYKGHLFAGRESLDRSKDSFMGRGFYNEFGIQAPLGYKELPMGSWCHKIGVGLIRKEAEDYHFLSAYELQAIPYQIDQNQQELKLQCQSSLVEGYGYRLEKTIALKKDGFEIHYLLENTGTKDIQTSEYNHNFISIEKKPINQDYILNFSFEIEPQGFDEFVNPENKLLVEQRRIRFTDEPSKEFFISNISGGRSVKAQWTLEHERLKLGLRETANFMTEAINLWGTKHVISPELFVVIDIAPGEQQRWTRSYDFFEIE